MIATRMYVTGGLGSRYQGEAFGDPYELPPDLAYAETCAAIASVMLAWRLLLATGDPRCADVIERTLYNAVLPSLSADGTRFFYVNPLQRRTDRAWGAPGQGERATWYACACCPPNLMRTIASFPHLVATHDREGVQIHQFVDGVIETAVAGGPVSLSTSTAYPWDGRVRVTVEASPAEPWTLSLRIPQWANGATIQDADGHARPIGPGMMRERREWHAGDHLVLDLGSDVRIVRPDPRVDAVRGSVAIERGPLVYALETADLPPGTALEDVTLPVDPAGRSVPRPDLGDGVIGVATDATTPSGLEVQAIPYFAWGNRAPDAMRVWIPTAPR
jgi:DUF1680 family protein